MITIDCPPDPPAPRTIPSAEEQAYRAYAAYTGGKTFDGRDMPQWHELPTRIQVAWHAAACAAHAARVQEDLRMAAANAMTLQGELLSTGDDDERKAWDRYFDDAFRETMSPDMLGGRAERVDWAADTADLRLAARRKRFPDAFAVTRPDRAERTIPLSEKTR